MFWMVWLAHNFKFYMPFLLFFHSVFVGNENEVKLQKFSPKKNFFHICFFFHE